MTFAQPLLTWLLYTNIFFLFPHFLHFLFTLCCHDFFIPICHKWLTALLKVRGLLLFQKPNLGKYYPHNNIYLEEICTPKHFESFLFKLVTSVNRIKDLIKMSESKTKSNALRNINLLVQRMRSKDFVSHWSPDLWSSSLDAPIQTFC